MNFHSVGNGKSSQLTNSMIFQRGRLNHQPVTAMVGLRHRNMLRYVETQIRFDSMFCFLRWFASKIDYSPVSLERWKYTGWWFGTFFIFPYIGNNHPNWLSYFSEGLKPPISYLNHQKSPSYSTFAFHKSWEIHISSNISLFFCLWGLHGEKTSLTGWWFQTFFIFHNIWDNPSHWLSYFFKLVKTTTQLTLW